MSSGPDHEPRIEALEERLKDLGKKSARKAVGKDGLGQGLDRGVEIHDGNENAHPIIQRDAVKQRKDFEMLRRDIKDEFTSIIRQEEQLPCSICQRFPKIIRVVECKTIFLDLIKNIYKRIQIWFVFSHIEVDDISSD